MDKFNTKRNGVRVKILETGEEFNSIQACADYLNVDARWLGNVVRGERGLRTCHGYHIERVDSSGNNVDIRRTEYRGRPGQRVKIVETGEVFESITDCASALNGSAGTIHDVLHKNRNRTAYKGLHFKIAD